ncbi:hypothetical protein ACFLZX_04920 [Nanoarchaeota archaeon]
MSDDCDADVEDFDQSEDYENSEVEYEAQEEGEYVEEEGGLVKNDGDVGRKLEEIIQDSSGNKETEDIEYKIEGKDNEEKGDLEYSSAEHSEEEKKEGRTLSDWKDELYHVIKGFLKIGDNEDPYEAVKEMEGTVTVVLPGLLHWPISVETFEKESGMDVIRFDDRDPDAIHEFLGHVYAETGHKPIVIGFSDGEKRLCSYIKKHGDDAILHSYGIGSDKNVHKVASKGKVTYINGGIDCLASMEKDYHGSPGNAPLVTLEGASHGGLFENPEVIRQIAGMVKERAFVNRGGVRYTPMHMYK